MSGDSTALHTALCGNTSVGPAMNKSRLKATKQTPEILRYFLPLLMINIDNYLHKYSCFNAISVKQTVES